MSDDNILEFPGTPTISSDDLKLRQARAEELHQDLCEEYRSWHARREAGSSIEFLLKKIAGLQAGIELTMKTVIARTK